MASGPITSWQIDGETMETVRDFILGGSKITEDGDCSHEIKRRLLLGRKTMTILDSILKSRDITLPTKVHPIKALVCPVVKYGCESWTIKKAEHWKIDAFKLWCWRRLLRDPWTARRSKQTILKEINPEYSLKGLMLRLKLQYSGLQMGRTNSLEKTLMLGKIEGRRTTGQQKTRLDGVTELMDMSLSKLRDLVMDRDAWRSAVHGWQKVGLNWVTEQRLCFVNKRIVVTQLLFAACFLPKYVISSVQFIHSVVSVSLQPHELQHVRLPCPSPTPRAYSNSCLLKQRCHPTISSSVISFSSPLQSFPAPGAFPMSQFFSSGGQTIGVSASASMLPMNIQDWFPLWWTGWISSQSKGLSRVFSNTRVWTHQFFSAQLSL